MDVNKRYFLAVIVFLAMALVLSGCRPLVANNEASDQLTELAKVEVRNYKGANLSSITDFRENSIKGPQIVEQGTYRLKVDGLVNKSKTYTYAQVVDDHKKYTKVVNLHCVEGWDVDILWEGILVRDLLNEAGVREDGQIVILHARDGYTTSFPVSYFMDNDIIMAYKMNEVTLPTARGFPFQLVAEDKWGYKWIKWIERLEVSDQLNYKGYWESRGYSNTGNLDESSIE
jgi:DMSO/TMAO reductase YedYZ molybdopterin-dependent catalytic subunit